VTFLDDARYDDETGTAPIPSGYSEVVFGELFRAAGWKRDEVIVANKLWWEFWPEQSAEEELDSSLARMGFDHVDLVYSWRAPDGLSIEELVGAIGGLIESGRVRAWGTGNWEPADLAAAAEIARAAGVPAPCAAQLPYSLVRRSHVESADAAAALDASGASVVASYVLHGGVLTGKYADATAAGRMAAALDDPELQPFLEAARELADIAARLGTSSAALAIAFALANQRVASVLFGATTPEQVTENVRAAELLDQLEPESLAELQAIC
jgi:aryl-alcohol dehydrogenase-like predicted oxidoreductase